VAVDEGGYIYVTDTFNNRVQMFTSALAYYTQWGTQGTADGQFNGPFGIAVDSSRDVLVVDSFNNRMQVFGPATTPATATTWGRLKSLYR